MYNYKLQRISNEGDYLIFKLSFILGTKGYSGVNVFYFGFIAVYLVEYGSKLLWLRTFVVIQGEWFNGKTAAFKVADLGSNPCSPAGSVEIT